jgi:hypothetical protein
VVHGGVASSTGSGSVLIDLAWAYLSPYQRLMSLGQGCKFGREFNCNSFAVWGAKVMLGVQGCVSAAELPRRFGWTLN